ncbi:hypothetical protein JCM8547_008273 [Rhodosporidiobolus lusitaniae]
MDDPPPTKASLVKWWKAFTSSSHKHQQQQPPPSSSSRAKQQPTRGGAGQPQPAHSLPAYLPPGRGLERGTDGKGRVFGVRLEDSLQYASVAISMVGPDGKQYVYGYVPIVVAKCGMWLKEAATQTEGIFRVSGSNKRINQLQTVFDEPPRYGKDFDWTGYSVHDAASVLRRYLNSLPEPVIPAALYLDFTAVLKQPQPIEASISAYRELIALLPPASRYLLLYLLDFLSVFARCSAQNLMTASNLAVVFQPGLVSDRGAGHNAFLGFPGFVEGRLPPNGSAAGGAQEQAGEHGRGKEVLEFLIENQAAFMLDLEPPVDEENQKTKGVSAKASPPLSASQGAGSYAQAQQAMAQQQPHQPVASTSAVPFDPSVHAAGGRTAPGGGADLARRGSEKSVERRRLRKSHDAKDGGKVKRSKTWGSSTARRKREGKEGPPASSSPQPPSPAAFTAPSPSRPPNALSPPPHSPSNTLSVPHSPPLGHQPSTKKPRKSADASLPSPVPAPVPVSAPGPTPSGAVAAAPSSVGSASSAGGDGSGGGGGGGGGGKEKKGGGLLGFAKSKRGSLTPEGGGGGR